MARDKRPEAAPQPGLSDLRLLDFVPAVSPHLQSPIWFAPIATQLESAIGGRYRTCFAAPRQHGKTTITKHAIPLIQLRHPRSRIFFATYAQEYTEIQSRDIRRISLEAGVKISADHNTLKGWTLDAGGDFTASSVDGRGNGLGADIVIVDDPFKGPEEAYAKARRDLVYDWFMQVVMMMLAPGGSVFIVASRWDDDDLSGRLISEQGFNEVRMPAINDGVDPNRAIGEALCPYGPDPAQPRDLEFLIELRDGRMGKDGVRRGGVGAHAFSALMQGICLPRADSMFGEAHYHD